MSFANQLKLLREANQVTQQELADYLNVSRTTIGGYETKSKEPNYDILEKIAGYFHVSIDYLISGHEFSEHASDESTLLYSMLQAITDNKKREELTKLVRSSTRMNDKDFERLLHYAELLLLQDEYQR